MTGININEYQTKVSEEHANVKNNKMQEQSHKALPRDDCSGFLLFVSGVSPHFQQYFSYIATVIIIDVRNWSIR